MTIQQNLDRLIDIKVYTTGTSSVRVLLNQFLIIGTTDVIETTERLREYTNSDDMLTDGFETSSPEYMAAALVFGASNPPPNVWIGRQDLDLSETALEAVTACRAASTDWYACMVCGATVEEIKAIASYIEACSPDSVYVATTDDADVLAGTVSPPNLCLYLKEHEYSRTMVMYSTDDDAPDAVASIMGYAMGGITGLANSAYDLFYQTCVGVAPESLTPAEVAIIEGDNGNLYLPYNGYYGFYEKGVMSDGTHFDQRIYRDSLVNDLKYAIADFRSSLKKLPQTDSGQTQLIHVIDQICDDYVTQGWLAPGEWTGVDILNLKNGDTLSKGYLCQSEAYSEQSVADRNARKAMPVYIAVKEAGSAETFLCAVYVNP